MYQVLPLFSMVSYNKISTDQECWRKALWSQPRGGQETKPEPWLVSYVILYLYLYSYVFIIKVTYQEWHPIVIQRWSFIRNIRYSSCEKEESQDSYRYIQIEIKLIQKIIWLITCRAKGQATHFVTAELRAGEFSISSNALIAGILRFYCIPYI